MRRLSLSIPELVCSSPAAEATSCTAGLSLSNIGYVTPKTGHVYYARKCSCDQSIQKVVCFKITGTGATWTCGAAEFPTARRLSLSNIGKVTPKNGLLHFTQKYSLNQSIARIVNLKITGTGATRTCAAGGNPTSRRLSLSNIG